MWWVCRRRGLDKVLACCASRVIASSAFSPQQFGNELATSGLHDELMTPEAQLWSFGRLVSCYVGDTCQGGDEGTMLQHAC